MYTEMVRFADRVDAGRQLAHMVELLLGPSATTENKSATSGEPTPTVIVLGLPRGGVPVAAEVAARLHAPLHVLVARKLGAPAQPELAVGAISEAGARVVDHDLAQRCGVTDTELANVERRERARLDTNSHAFGVDRRPPLVGRTVVIVDDGIATGATARAACRAARTLGAARVVLAVPAAPTDWRTRLAEEADDLVCVIEQDVPAVGCWYADFAQVSDRDVVALLDTAAGRATAARTSADRPPADRPTDGLPSSA
ncbi:MAG: phosphoribosyltransferase [Ilumatobacteraceae bacterium]